MVLGMIKVYESVCSLLLGWTFRELYPKYA